MDEIKPERPGRGELVAKILVGVCLAALITLCIWKWSDIMVIFASKEALKSWLDSLGPWAALAFIFLQFLQVVIFIIPGEVTQVAGGYFFGFGFGLLYSVVGIALGSGFAFLVSRMLGIDFVTRLFGQANVERFSAFITTPRARVPFFLLFLIPGIPKDILCYVAGISKLEFGAFMLISMIARLPALIVSIIFGNAAAEGNNLVLVIVGISASVLFLLGLIFRTQIHAWIEHVLHKKDS